LAGDLAADRGQLVDRHRVRGEVALLLLDRRGFVLGTSVLPEAQGDERGHHHEQQRVEGQHPRRGQDTKHTIEARGPPPVFRTGPTASPGGPQVPYPAGRSTRSTAMTARWSE